MSELDVGRYLRVSFAKGADYIEVDELGVDANLSPVTFPLRLSLDSIPPKLIYLTWSGL